MAGDKMGTTDYRRARFMPLAVPSGQAALRGNQRAGIGPGPQRPL